MSAPLLHLEGVGKSFRRYRREIDRVLRWFGLPMPAPEERWVLREIGLSIHPGEAVGIIGRNGAGKSTLLKMVAGITRPSEGRIGVNGRVAAILELGMGFSGELTGRQNAFHAAGMMGFTQGEIAGAIDDIAGFAELGAFFDQPIRVYSSGMQMRLAFAVATAFRPDILIVDEALAVGDAYFQHKSMERIRAFQREGTSLILVSHDKVALQSICQRIVLLEEGRIARDGEPEEVLDYYNALIAAREGEAIETLAHESGRVQTVSGSREAVIETIALIDAAGKTVDTLSTGAMTTLRVSVLANADLDRLVLGFSIKTRFGQTMFGTNSHFLGQPLETVRQGELVTFSLAFHAALAPGSYSISTALVGGESHIGSNYEWRDLALLFSVVNDELPPFDGLAHMPIELAVVRQEPT